MELMITLIYNLDMLQGVFPSACAGPAYHISIYNFDMLGASTCMPKRDIYMADQMLIIPRGYFPSYAHTSKRGIHVTGLVNINTCQMDASLHAWMHHMGGLR